MIIEHVFTEYALRCGLCGAVAYFAGSIEELLRLAEFDGWRVGESEERDEDVCPSCGGEPGR